MMRTSRAQGHEGRRGEGACARGVASVWHHYHRPRVSIDHSGCVGCVSFCWVWWEDPWRGVGVSFLFLAGSFICAVFSGFAPGLVLAGVEDGSGEGVFGVEHVSRDSAVLCYSCLAAMDAGLRERACLERLFEHDYMARSPLSFTLEVDA
ncbi:hypothetical protein F5144DRAFT_304070 [Chaetomium tenue]|uniref:Uncharacterized protein n=1 Tax=Chaetomium tenue TaxID=1854479 RepID=A0ACB7P2N6_9PEZI|nr:hypothetical protein F5144DRAFT_304070 [Chaetomium globosum]